MTLARLVPLVAILMAAAISARLAPAQDKPAPSKPTPEKAAPDKPAPDAQPAAPKPLAKAQVASIVLSGGLPESAGAPGVFGDIAPSLADVVQRLDRAAQDKDVAAVLLRLRSPELGRGKLHELRSAIARVRQAGKKVIAELREGAAGEYQLAAACDEIILPESGMLMVPGVRAEVTFYKGLFDKLGIHAEMLQVGDFKGAAEPYTRQRMSPAFRKQYETLLDDFYEQMIESIAADRKLDPAKVRQLVDTGLFTPAQAKEAGLIDRVAYQDETPGRLRELLNAEKVEIVDNYGKKKVDTDFSGMLGMVKLFELLMGVEPAKRSTANRKLAVVYASGTIVTGESGVSLMGGESLGSDTIIKALRKCSEDKSVVAIVLRIDSPGGSALASDLMWREIQRIEKPVVASMGDVAASGGYYIAMGCDKIYAEPGTLTGSIGVVGGKLSIQGLTEKLGVNTEIISRGKNSGILSMETPFTDSERQVWQDSMREIYRQFTTKAAAGRKLPLDKLEQLAGGRVWTGRQAKANGLVDELGTLRDALQAAKKAAGIAEEEKLEIMSLPEPKNFLDQLLGSGAGASSRLADSLEAAADSAPALKHLDEVRQLRRLFSEPGVLLMPAKIRVN